MVILGGEAVKAASRSVRLERPHESHIPWGSIWLLDNHLNRTPVRYNLRGNPVHNPATAR